MRVTGYSERGALNSLFYEFAYSNAPLQLLESFLRLAHFPGEPIAMPLTDASVLIEQSLSDFGDADAILLLESGATKWVIFLEAKVKAQARFWTLDEEFSNFGAGLPSASLRPFVKPVYPALP